MTSDVLKAWHGVAFSKFAGNISKQIKQALGVAGVKTLISAWNVKGTEEKEGTQIDLLIIRNNNVVNLCVVKFASAPYTISKEEEQRLRQLASLPTGLSLKIIENIHKRMLQSTHHFLHPHQLASDKLHR